MLRCLLCLKVSVFNVYLCGLTHTTRSRPPFSAKVLCVCVCGQPTVTGQWSRTVQQLAPTLVHLPELTPSLPYRSSRRAKCATASWQRSLTGQPGVTNPRCHPLPFGPCRHVSGAALDGPDSQQHGTATTAGGLPGSHHLVLDGQSLFSRGGGGGADRFH